MPRVEWADRLVRWTTAVSVVVLAGIAAVISYKHMFTLVHRYGETSWTAALLPLSVDGMIVASSMSLLEASRMGRRSGGLPWALLVLGSAASLSANVAVAEPSAVGRVIAAWPSAALIGSYELLMGQIRQASARGTSEQAATSYAACMAEFMGTSGSDVLSYEGSGNPGIPYVAHTSLTADDAVSYRAHTGREEWPKRSGRTRAAEGEALIRNADEGQAGRGGRADRPRAPLRRSAAGLRCEAWQWALSNRSLAGDLPSGKAIAEEFGRRERWGRLVKQAGLAGSL